MNSHGVITHPSNVRVCRFRHPRTKRGAAAVLQACGSRQSYAGALPLCAGRKLFYTPETEIQAAKQGKAPLSAFGAACWPAYAQAFHFASRRAPPCALGNTRRHMACSPHLPENTGRGFRSSHAFGSVIALPLRRPPVPASAHGSARKGI